jgi:hypothetical protein
MNNTVRPEFAAWEKLMLAQIKSSESAIECLESEAKAAREMVKHQRRMLKLGRQGERKVKQ